MIPVGRRGAPPAPPPPTPPKVTTNWVVLKYVVRNQLDGCVFTMDHELVRDAPKNDTDKQLGSTNDCLTVVGKPSNTYVFC